MTNGELKKYLTNHRHDEQAFSEVLEIFINRTANSLSYPSPSTMSYEEIEAIFKAKLNSDSN